MSQNSGLNRRNFLKGAGITALAGAAPAVAIADDDDGRGLFRNGNYDFDTVYERAGWNCSRWDSPARRYPNGEFKYGMGVATMDFECAPCITEALAERCKHHTWGYMSSTDSLKEAIAEFNAERNKLELDPSTIQLSAGVLSRPDRGPAHLFATGQQGRAAVAQLLGFLFHDAPHLHDRRRQRDVPQGWPLRDRLG